MGSSRTARPLRLPAVYRLGAALGLVLVSVPVALPAQQLDSERPVEPSPPAGPPAVVVAGPDAGYVFDREGEVVRVGRDGTQTGTASVGSYSTPFGTAAGDRVVFGGIRCEGSGCSARTAHLTVLDADGRIEDSLALPHGAASVEADGIGPSGIALAGVEGGSLWVDIGSALLQVRVAPLAVTAEVPAFGGEPCVVDGVLHTLSASGGTYGDQGVDLSLGADVPPFRLELHRWDEGGWRPVAGGATTMVYGRNAYCTSGGYEVRSAGRTVERWEPGIGWQAVAADEGESSGSGDPTPGGLAPVTTSSGRRYVVDAEGELVDITDPGPARPTGTMITEPVGSDMPPAVQVDDSGGPLFWCATTYRAGAALTRCAGASGPHHRAAFTLPDIGSTSEPGLDSRFEIHHYNICSAACGDGVRPHSRDVVVQLVERRRPVALSLNELCYDDGIHLTDRLPGLAVGAGFVSLDQAVTCPGAVKQYGNQVRVHTSSRAGTWARFPTQSDGECDHRVRECRGIACAETVVTGSQPDRVICSAHLESSRRSPEVASAQAREYVELVEALHPDRPARVLAGDFNLDSDDVDAVLGPAGYRAAVTGPTMNPHRPPADKRLDLIYLGGPEAPEAPETPAAPVGATYCDTQAADHCYVIVPT